MNKTTLLVLRYLFWGLTLSIMFLLFDFSSQTRTESAAISSNITETIIKIIYEEYETLPEETRVNILHIAHVFIRKLAHFTSFFFMGVFASNAMLTYNVKPKIKFLVPLIIGLLYAVVDELHQATVPGRGPMVLDVLLDFIGCLCGTVCVFLIVYYFERRKKNEREQKLKN